MEGAIYMLWNNFNLIMQRNFGGENVFLWFFFFFRKYVSGLMSKWNLFDVINSVILKFPAALKFPAVVFSF